MFRGQVAATPSEALTLQQLAANGAGVNDDDFLLEEEKGGTPLTSENNIGSVEEAEARLDDAAQIGELVAARAGSV